MKIVFALFMILIFIFLNSYIGLSVGMDQAKLPWKGKHPPKKPKKSTLVVTKGCYVQTTILGQNKRKRTVQQKVEFGRGLKTAKTNGNILSGPSVNEPIL